MKLALLLPFALLGHVKALSFISDSFTLTSTITGAFGPDIVMDESGLRLLTSEEGRLQLFERASLESDFARSGEGIELPEGTSRYPVSADEALRHGVLIIDSRVFFIDVVENKLIEEGGGRSCAMSGDGKWAVVGKPQGAGSLEMWHREADSAVWNRYGDPLTMNHGEGLGTVVAINYDGSLVACSFSAQSEERALHLYSRHATDGTYTHFSPLLHVSHDSLMASPMQGRNEGLEQVPVIGLSGDGLTVTWGAPLEHYGGAPLWVSRERGMAFSVYNWFDPSLMQTTKEGGSAKGVMIARDAQIACVTVAGGGMAVYSRDVINLFGPGTYYSDLGAWGEALPTLWCGRAAIAARVEGGLLVRSTVKPTTWTDSTSAGLGLRAGILGALLLFFVGASM